MLLSLVEYTYIYKIYVSADSADVSCLDCPTTTCIRKAQWFRRICGVKHHVMGTSCGSCHKLSWSQGSTYEWTTSEKGSYINNTWIQIMCKCLGQARAVDLVNDEGYTPSIDIHFVHFYSFFLAGRFLKKAASSWNPSCCIPPSSTPRAFIFFFSAALARSSVS